MQGERRLATLMESVRTGAASEQERIDLLFLIAKSKSGTEVRPLVEELATDPCEEVRFYALQTLVLDLKVKDERAADLCWKALTLDHDVNVRDVAACCLGSIYVASFRQDVVDRLRAVFLEVASCPSLQWAVFDSMRLVVDLVPERWGLSREALMNSRPGTGRLAEIDQAMAIGKAREIEKLKS